MKITKIVAFAITLTWLAGARCEIYMGLAPFMSVVKVKEKYPNATLFDMKPVWLAPSESFKVLSGPGIAGRIFLKFSHLDKRNEISRSAALKKIEENPNGDNTADQKLVDFYSQVLSSPLDDRLTLDWVRWLPPAPVPYTRLASKYGIAEKCDFKADTFEPYCEWPSRGILATLDDKKEDVISIDFSFTQGDWATAMGLPKISNNPPLKPKTKTTNSSAKPTNPM